MSPARATLLGVCIGLSTLIAAPRAAAQDEAPKEVIVYTALDRGFSEPILSRFEQRTGIKIRAKYDTESTKTVGLVNAIRAEQDRPRCDVFWNNEIVNTLRLKSEGLLQPVYPPNAVDYPAQFKDPQGLWYGFAARARVLIVNNDLVPSGTAPATLAELSTPQWKGKVGIAKPLFGTTASHVACLYATWGQQATEAWLAALKTNDIAVLAGNKTCARAVAAGRLHCALTDTDDAVIEIAAGKPVRIVYLDVRPNEQGTLFIPNTLAVIRGCRNPGGAERLIDYLLSAEVEAMLAAGPSAQIPLNRTFEGTVRVKTPREVQAMAVDFEQAARMFSSAAQFIELHFLE